MLNITHYALHFTLRALMANMQSGLASPLHVPSGRIRNTEYGIWKMEDKIRNTEYATRNTQHGIWNMQYASS